ncbi:hypothetical protein RHMOL_Rhmol06G0279700 [Rhododendron molle]|uniref:Uncharacterized protein n=1 Tax=Rhododendron molle TaxID=49168 RepID=A0ACC0NIB5_RHOML|nr:hypothetical protein RHMOL_Rhmol06G0279700 [Rhododendron molle]
MSGRQPTKPVWEEEEAAGKKAEITGRKRPRGSSDWEFDEEEEKKMAHKKKELTATDMSTGQGHLSLPWGKLKDKKFREKAFLSTKRNGNDVAKMAARLIAENGKEHEIDIRQWNMSKGIYNVVKDLHAEFEERIQNLGGTEATLVLKKELTATDISPDHKRLSLLRGKLKHKEFLDKAFSATRRNGNGIAKMATRLISENGKQHEIDIRQWNMNQGIYNVVKGWNEVVGEHELRATLAI